jgi:hypothetical protein
VYTDPSGAGTPATATLAASADTAVQVVGSSQWNRYVLPSPVVVRSGDYYIGLQDLVADTTTNYIMDYDARAANDSFYQADSIDPASYGAVPRRHGELDGAGPRNGTGRRQRHPHLGGRVQRGRGSGTGLRRLPGCGGQLVRLHEPDLHDGGARSWTIERPPSGAFWIVVPQTSVAEGSYGLATSGERRPSAGACRPQAVGACP